MKLHTGAAAEACLVCGAAAGAPCAAEPAGPRVGAYHTDRVLAASSATRTANAAAKAAATKTTKGT